MLRRGCEPGLVASRRPAVVTLHNADSTIYGTQSHLAWVTGYRWKFLGEGEAKDWRSKLQEIKQTAHRAYNAEISGLIGTAVSIRARKLWENW